MHKDRYTFQDFIKIMERLIAPDGCPWDRVQTHESLKRYMLEECYEVVEAINKGDMENLREELGDVLLQVVFHSILAQREGEFTLEDVVDEVSRKMINRHRHIFGDTVANTPQEVLKSWDEIKREEKGYTNATSQLRNIPSALPALMRAEKVLAKGEKNAYPQEETGVLIQGAEEILELLKSGENIPKEEKMDKIGKLLLIITNISGKNQINPEFALTNALETYINKFEYFENTGVAKGLLDEDTQS